MRHKLAITDNYKMSFTKIKHYKVAREKCSYEWVFITFNAVTENRSLCQLQSAGSSCLEKTEKVLQGQS